jgi:alkylated DNA repair protein (DNA oxidative demethylase)
MNQLPLLFPRSRRTLAEGAVHIPDWLTIDEQRHLVDACRQWAKPPAPMRATRLPNGGVMSVRSVCLGWHWVPYRYTRFAEDTDGAPVDPLPEWLVQLGRRAVSDAHENPAEGAAYEADAALINFYDVDARLGLHQDHEERASAPVVSISLGDSAIFRFGNTETRGRPYTDIELHSGDLVVFGGPSRYAYHGVPKILPGTGPTEIGLTRGRLNVTLRVIGLE